VVIAISAACNNANTVNRNKKSDTEVMISSLFMGATGPLGDTPPPIANADSGDFASAVKSRRIGKSFLRRGRDVLMDVDDAVLFRLLLTLFHNLLRMEGPSFLLEAS